MNSRISPSFPIHLYLFFISLIITFSFPPSSSFNIDWYRACSNKFNCGNITNVGFPFWGGFRQYGCGIPSLMLLCFENITTIIELMDVKYLVLEFNQISQTLRIARSDYTDDLCPEKFINTTLDYNLFDSNPNPNHGYINITLLYCAFPRDGSPGQFSCPEYEFGSIIVGDIGPGICNESVIIPVSYSGVNGVVNSSEILGAIKEGFEVKWRNDSGCGDCEESKGVCGFDLGLNLTTCYCYGYSSGLMICPSLPEDGAPTATTIPSESNVRLKAAIGISSGLMGIVVFSIVIICIHRRRRRELPSKILSTVRKQKRTVALMMNPGPKQYPYSQIKKMTNSFSHKLGEGGYGTVYRGKLDDGSLVAIKVLRVLQGENDDCKEDFINEIASISRTSHVNIVSLLGFSYNSKETALVYEFMPNGSLDRFISRNRNLELKTLHRIVVGVARGLEYLHCGCNTRIVHFDIKPQNILLDEDFNPKISDFGLAKLCKRKESIVSMLGTRGTAGFIAPEVFSRAFGAVSYKSDVYSYGMLLLETILGGRRNMAGSVVLSNESETYFPDWIFKRIEVGKNIRSDQTVIEEEEEIEWKMIIVGLWCIQTSPSDRPSMSKVLEMLEGNVQSLQIPPKPLLVLPNMSSQETATQSLPSEGY